MPRIGTLTASAVFALAAAALPLGAANAGDRPAGDAETASPPLILAQQLKAATPEGADARIMQTYKQATWRRYQSLAGGRPQADPPTDCPPLDPQVCIDSWKLKPVNPFE